MNTANLSTRAAPLLKSHSFHCKMDSLIKKVEGEGATVPSDLTTHMQSVIVVILFCL